MSVQIIPPGIETSEQYHRSGAIGSTLISHFLRSPRLFDLIRTGTYIPESTASMKLGNAFHILLDPGGNFTSRYRIGPEVDHRTKEWKAAVLAAKTDGVELLPSDDLNTLTAMQTSVQANPIAASLMEGAEHEVGFRMPSPYGENVLQCRADGLHRWTHLIDLKTTADVDDFPKSILTYGYHRQAALYSWIVHESCGEWLPFSFVVIEKEAPLYRCRVFDLTPEFITRGWQEVEAALIEIGKRTAANDWADHRDAEMLSPPPWMVERAKMEAA